MPAFLAALLGGLINSAGTIVGKVLISLGIGYVTYTGLSESLDWLQTQLSSSFSGLPPEALQVLSALKVGQALAIILSAMAGRLVLNGLNSSGLKKMVLK